jgi:hypothetical protein
MIEQHIYRHFIETSVADPGLKTSRICNTECLTCYKYTKKISVPAGTTFSIHYININKFGGPTLLQVQKCPKIFFHYHGKNK